MTFASQAFLYYFFPIFLIAYFSFKGMRAKNFIFILFSFLFYSQSRPRYLVILLVSIVFNFAIGLALDKSEGNIRKIIFIIGVVANLLVLLVFKYTGFFVENLDMALAHSGVHLPTPQISLPLGISFYTFHAISYIADVMKRRINANRRIDEFTLYMSMFPQLVAGPIVRYSTVSRQLSKRRLTLGRFAAGMRIFIMGLAWKLLIADQIAPIADFVFAPTLLPSFAEAWLGLYAYAMQLYFDFGGYSAMAVGLGVMTGFKLPRNFRLPYAALSITDFWRRWHMSLSAWLRDYVYIPLGGSRGSSSRTYTNLAAVFLLCGLWHGASWTFVVWGAYHGIFLIIERAGVSNVLGRLPKGIGHIYTVLVAFLGWVWFRSPDFGTAIKMFKSLLGLNGFGDMSFSLYMALSPITMTALATAGLLSLWKWPPPPWSAFLGRTSTLRAMADTSFVLILLAFCMIVAAASSFSPFLYYRF
jgi:alginate O-acetyltransferase complex protein AlgI